MLDRIVEGCVTFAIDAQSLCELQLFVRIQGSVPRDVAFRFAHRTRTNFNNCRQRDLTSYHMLWTSPNVVPAR